MMAGSGVYRLRNSRKAPKSMPREFHGIVDHSGLRGTDTRHVKVDVNVGSGLDPGGRKTPYGTTRGEYPKYTKPPISNEEPVRGEGPKRERHKQKQ